MFNWLFNCMLESSLHFSPPSIQSILLVYKNLLPVLRTSQGQGASTTYSQTKQTNNMSELSLKILETLYQTLVTWRSLAEPQSKIADYQTPKYLNWKPTIPDSRSKITHNVSQSKLALPGTPMHLQRCLEDGGQTANFPLSVIRFVLNTFS